MLIYSPRGKIMVETVNESKKTGRILLSKKLALIGIAVFILSTISAILSYTNYGFYTQYLSELGIGSTAILFNAGVIISGLLLIPLFVFHYKENDFFSQLICFLGIACAVFFIGVGIFPLTVSDIHLFTAALFFITMALTIIFALIEFLKENYKQNKFSHTTKFFFHFVSIFAFTLILSYLILGYPAWQKLAVLGIGIWLFDWILIK